MAWQKKILQNRLAGEMCLSSFKTSNRLKFGFQEFACNSANVRRFQMGKRFIGPRRIHCGKSSILLLSYLFYYQKVKEFSLIAAEVCAEYGTFTPYIFNRLFKLDNGG